ncbi:DnaA N-terminal domain-containing protein [Bacillus sp. MUM 13]|uniref:DnaA N-terminal domain-containing protein n=1 Tax=Bacillus sp. MUM 13 TaxID=1678001 RepID=UPI0008F58DE4|nr:DnaA N-terminal domain-containing protein [Bacillus sp. MUM 13]OIK06465.1 hypothetical protein BIV59_21475 [Bacillus sp. MUM 13]
MDENKKNLKGTSDDLTYFRRVKSEGKDPRLRFEKKENGEVFSKIVNYPAMDKVFFSNSDVTNFSLDKYGKSIPYVEGEITILNNYFFDFWSYFLTAEGVALYGHLRRYAYGNKDWCFPDIKKIALKMDKSYPAVLRYMEVLEHFGFIYKFSVLNKSKENLESKPIFKIRKMIPLLTNVLIEGNSDLIIPSDAKPHMQNAYKKEIIGLPKALRDDHEKYLKEIFQVNDDFNMDKQLDFEEIFSKLVSTGHVYRTKRRRSQIKQMEIHTVLRQEMTEQEAIILERLLEKAQHKISKPSYETWFANILLKKDSKTYTIFVPNEFARDWIEDKYIQSICEWLKELDEDIENIRIELLAN